VHLWFSEPVQTVRHGLVVISPSGQQVEQGVIQIDQNELSIAVEATELGTYQVNWQVISEDTHPQSGYFVFSVGYTSQLSQVARSRQANVETPVGLILQVLGQWLHFIGYALAFGSLLLELSVIRPVLKQINATLNNELAQQTIWRLVSIGIGLLLVAEPVALLGQTGSFDLDLAGDMLSSSFGRVLAQRLGAAVLLWVLLGIMRLGLLGANYVGLGLGVILALADGQASHAVSSGPLLLGLGLNTIHIAAMGVWVGGLSTLVALWNFPNTPLLEIKVAVADYHKRLVYRFGRLASLALLWLIASGLGMSYWHLAQFSDLLNNTYGKILLLKVIVLAFTLGYTSYVLLRSKVPSRHNWLLELSVLVGILSLAALLVSLPPPA
jgi:copper transport protein